MKKPKIIVKGIVSIMGTNWEYRLYNEEDFLKVNPDCADDGAVILLRKREIHFTEEQRDIGTIRHEVRHAFIDGLYLDNARLTNKQYEEMHCSLDQYKWDEMASVSEAIYEALNYEFFST